MFPQITQPWSDLNSCKRLLLSSNARHTPDGLVSHTQTPREVQLLQLSALLGHFLDRRVRDVGINRHWERAQRRALPRHVTHDFVLQLAAGGDVQRAQVRAVIRQTAQCQAVHPLAVCQAQVCETRAAQRHRHQSVTAQVNTAAQVHAQQVLVLTNHRQKLFIRDPIRAVADTEVVEDLIVAKHGAEGFFGNVRTRLRRNTGGIVWNTVQQNGQYSSDWTVSEFSPSPAQGQTYGSWPGTPVREHESSCWRAAGWPGDAEAGNRTRVSLTHPPRAGPADDTCHNTTHTHRYDINGKGRVRQDVSGKSVIPLIQYIYKKKWLKI